MRLFRRQRVKDAIFIALLAAAPLASLAQENEGRPHIERSDRPGEEGRDGRSEGRSEKERALEDEKKKIEEKIKAVDDRKNDDGLKPGEDRATKDRFTKADEIARRIDLTKPGNGDVHDLDTLIKETGRDTEIDRKKLKSAEDLSREVIEKRNEKGDYGLGSATKETVDRAGRDFVGEDARESSDGIALISKNGLRRYRFPKYKAYQDKVQANFERRSDPEGKWLSNGHVDIGQE
jgi:hypothetical protein